MADSKVSELTAATAVNSADLLYLVQANADKKLSISTLLANLPNTFTKVGGLFGLNLSNPQTIVGAGTINASTLFTSISNSSGVFSLNIEDGTYVGQIKLIMCTAAAGTSSITSNVKGVSSIAFTAAGQTAILIWYNSDWWIIGGSATVTF
jgi:hypothetical protein